MMRSKRWAKYDASGNKQKVGYLRSDAAVAYDENPLSLFRYRDKTILRSKNKSRGAGTFSAGGDAKVRRQTKS